MRSRRDRTDSAVPGASYRPPELASTQSAASTELAVAAHPGWAARPSTPGGIGAVEAALTAGLVATGLHGTEAASAVLLFRLLTFWLPVPVGWVAFNYLERRHDL